MFLGEKVIREIRKRNAIDTRLKKLLFNLSESDFFYYLLIMVIIKDGSSNMLRTYEVNLVFCEKSDLCTMLLIVIFDNQFRYFYVDRNHVYLLFTI